MRDRIIHIDLIPIIAAGWKAAEDVQDYSWVWRWIQKTCLCILETRTLWILFTYKIACMYKQLSLNAKP